MADKVSVTNHHSYWSRVKNSASKIWWWILLVIVSIFLLSRNEHNFVEQKKALKEWAELVQKTNSEQIDSSLNGKEVYLYWDTTSDAESLKDTTFGIIVDDLKLARTVEMYQREETSDTKCTDNVWGSEDCTTTYEYYKTWDDNKIDSQNFHETEWHTNPNNWEFESNEWTKSPIKVWAYTLSDVFINQLNKFEKINLDEQNIIVPEKYKTTKTQNTNNVDSNNDSYLYWDSNTGDNNYENFHQHQNYIYIWKDENDPQIWDLKITFSSVKEWTVSIIWMQQNNTLTSYTTSNNRNIALLENGIVSAEKMFLNAQEANKLLTWIIRIIWLILMYSWFSMIFQLVETIAKVLPFLSNILWIGTWIISFCCTLVLWFVTIWIARLVVRPITGIICLIIAAWWVFLLIKSRKDKKWTLNNNTKSKNNSETEIIEC